MMKRAGSGSICHWYGSADSDPDRTKISRIHNTAEKLTFRPESRLFRWKICFFQPLYFLLDIELRSLATLALAVRRSTQYRNPTYVFPEMKRCGLVPNSFIHVSVSWSIYIFLRAVCLFGCSKIGWEYIKRSRIHECGNWGREHYNSVLEITRPTQFHFWEYINRNQTVLLDFHLKCTEAGVLVRK